MITINNELIRSLSPCYDPTEKGIPDDETLSVLEWVEKYRGTVPGKDIIWLLCHKEFMSDKDLGLFAVWCAREALKTVDKPDIRSIEACNVAEKYANGEATDEELEDTYDAVAAARFTARSAADAYTAAYYAVFATASPVAAYTVTCYAADGDTTIHATQLDKLLTYLK